MGAAFLPNPAMNVGFTAAEARAGLLVGHAPHQETPAEFTALLGQFVADLTMG